MALDDILCPSNVQAAIARISEEVSGPSQEQHARLVTIDQELSDIRQRQARVMEAYEKDAYTVDDFGWRMTPLREAEADLKEKRAQAARDLSEQTTMASDPQQVLEFVREVSAFMGHSSPKDRKQILKRFIKCVWLEPGWGTVEYRIPLPKDAKRPQATELVLALDEPVPPITRAAPPKRAEGRTFEFSFALPGNTQSKKEAPPTPTIPPPRKNPGPEKSNNKPSGNAGTKASPKAGTAGNVREPNSNLSSKDAPQVRRESDRIRRQRPERNEYQRRIAKEMRQKAKALGKCKSCPQPAIPGQTRCPSCAEKHRVSRRRNDGQRRAMAMQSATTEKLGTLSLTQ